MTTSKKYPRSPHLPWSPGGTNDDKRMLDVSNLLGTEIVITEKLDGSNLSYTNSNVFARSHSNTPSHISFNIAKATHAQIKYNIPIALSIFCEFCYAIHSIEYVGLPNYSFIFGIREDNSQQWWDWDLVVEQALDIGLPTAPVLFRGTINSSKELQILTEKLGNQPSFFGGVREGVVVRTLKGYPDSNFSNCLAKWVRKDHVKTDKHWKDSEVKPQKLIKT